MINEKYNKWTVIDGPVKGKIKVKCKCGFERWSHVHIIRDGHSKGCKSCSIRDRASNPAFGDLGGSQLWHIKASAERRGYKFNVSSEYLWNLLVEQNFKCALTDVDLYIQRVRSPEVTASVDRIDTTKGYVEGNVRWVHKVVNRIKWDMQDDEMYKWIGLIHKGKK